MKNSVFGTIRLCFLLCPALVGLSAGCSKDDGPNGDSRDPVWTYNSGENPYGSRPFITGGKIIVCSREEDIDKGTVHCVNLSNGSSVWKMTDSTVIRNNPVVYDNLVIYGGYNVHALNLSDGSHKWDYQDELIHFGLYSSPGMADGSACVAFTFGLVKLGVSSGGLIWKNSEYVFQNLAISAPVYNQGKVYYANMVGELICVNANTGSTDWMLAFDNGFTNAPLVTNDRIYAGCHEADASRSSVFCYQLDGTTKVWSAKIWEVVSDMAIDGNRLFVVGGYILYCLSATDGTENWKYEMNAGSVAEPVVSDGKVYIGTGEKLMCFDESTGKLKWSYQTSDGKGFSSPAFSGDRLYVTCEDGKLYCFEK